MPAYTENCPASQIETQKKKNWYDSFIYLLGLFKHDFTLPSHHNPYYHPSHLTEGRRENDSLQIDSMFVAQ